MLALLLLLIVFGLGFGVGAIAASCGLLMALTTGKLAVKYGISGEVLLYDEGELFLDSEESQHLRNLFND